MSEWNKDQWGAQPPPAGHAPVFNTGSAPYAPPANYPPQNYDAKSPFEGERFKPKKKINDPIILIFFILQVCQVVAVLVVEY